MVSAIVLGGGGGTSSVRLRIGVFVAVSFSVVQGDGRGLGTGFGVGVGVGTGAAPGVPGFGGVRTAADDECRAPSAPSATSPAAPINHNAVRRDGPRASSSASATGDTLAVFQGIYGFYRGPNQAILVSKGVS
ncbi:hypothetical protein GCM10009678_41970 [Actinomadura kijaniata]